ncbi:hypothetical protein Tco_0986622 [Tanacetum coccineum]
MKSTKPKVKGVVIQEMGKSTTTISSQLSLQQSQDKGKRILIEPVKPMNKKDLIMLDEEVALKLQAKLIKKKDLQVVEQTLREKKKAFAAKNSRRGKEQTNTPTKAQTENSLCFHWHSQDEYRLRLNEHYAKGEDLEDLYKLVKAKYESTRPVEDLDLLLWGDLKTMFEPHVEDAVWRNQQAYKVLDWKLYDSCRVHSLRMQHMQIYMLVEKKYPLAPLTLPMMFEKKLNIDYKSEMAYQLLKLIIKQLKK